MAGQKSRVARLPGRGPAGRGLPGRRASGRGVTGRRRAGLEQDGLARGIGLIAGVAALAAGGIAAGFELERRIVSKRISRKRESHPEPFFSLRSDGPVITTPDGVVLHTEVDDLVTSGPDDLTIVLVHGYALSLDCWHFQRKLFRKTHRVVLYDQRSHGRSSRSEAGLCRIPQLAADLLQVLDEVVGPGPVVLIGHSMGGMTIMQLAADHPEMFGSRVLAVGLVSTSAGDLANHSPIRGIPGEAFARIAKPLMATLNRIPELVERGRKAGSDIGYVVTRRMAFGSEVPVSFVEFMSEMLGETSLEVVADYYPAFAEVDERAGLEVLRRLPTAVIGGESDVITPVAHTDRIVELLPDAESLRMPASGHMGMLEHAAEYNAVLARLVAKAEKVLADRSLPMARD